MAGTSVGFVALSTVRLCQFVILPVLFSVSVNWDKHLALLFLSLLPHPFQKFLAEPALLIIFVLNHRKTCEM